MIEDYEAIEIFDLVYDDIGLHKEYDTEEQCIIVYKEGNECWRVSLVELSIKYIYKMAFGE